MKFQIPRMSIVSWTFIALSIGSVSYLAFSALDYVAFYPALAELQASTWKISFRGGSSANASLVVKVSVSNPSGSSAFTITNLVLTIFFTNSSSSSNSSYLLFAPGGLLANQDVTQKLVTHYRTLRGWVRAVENISFSVDQGEALGLAGESGCGKSTVALSLLKILPSGGTIRHGKIVFQDQDLIPLSESEMRKIRWKGISIVFQGAMNALNPVYKVGEQIAEAIKIHEEGVAGSEV